MLTSMITANRVLFSSICQFDKCGERQVDIVLMLKFPTNLSSNSLFKQRKFFIFRMIELNEVILYNIITLFFPISLTVCISEI